MTEPTELYNSPTFGAGLRRYLFQYNNSNTQAMVKDHIIEQLRMFEPCVVPEKTTIVDGLLATGNNNNIAQEYNKLNLTVMLVTTFGDKVEVDLNVNK